jgi:hypothetical protein
MRIISFLTRSLLIILGVAIAVALIGREALLLWSSAQLQTDVKVLRQLVISRSHIKQCHEKGSALIEGGQIAIAQLRFTSSTEYNLEIVCDQYQLAPIVIKSAALPPLVKKVPGSSGIVFDTEYSAVAIEIFGRGRTIVAADRSVSTNNKPVPLGTGPAAACEAYGFICCQDDSEVGVGDQIAGATNCPQNCHTQCQRRPVLLSLTADPFIDSKTRTVTMTSGQQLAVHFTVQPGVSQNLIARLDFGDGTVDQINSSEGTFTHVYSCLNNKCQYTAKIYVEDDTGALAADAVHSSFSITVVR